MAAVPIVLNSCTITGRDPATTNPQGRIQLDVRKYEVGGLKEFCDETACLLGPDGLPLRGLGIGLREVDQTEPEDPGNVVGDGCYENPLRIDSNNCLWVKWSKPRAEVCNRFSNSEFFISGGATGEKTALGSTVQRSVTNNTCDRCKIIRKVTICNAGIEDPPSDLQFDAGDEPVVPVTARNEANPPLYGFECSGLDRCTPKAADAVYQISSPEGEICRVTRACTGGCSAYSGTIEFDPVFIDPGDTYDFVVTPQLLMESPASGPFKISRGDIKVCLQLVCPVTGEEFNEDQI